MISLDHFCDLAEIHKITLKVDQAALLIYFNAKATGESSVTIKQINTLFDKVGLPPANAYRLKQFLAASRAINRGESKGTYRLSRLRFLELQERYGAFFSTATPPVSEAANIGSTPFLTKTEVESARKMAELYLVIHCYENSARKLIDAILTQKLGPHWFELAVTKPSMKDQVKTRREKEQKNKWITPRGDSPLFYLDWGDLLYLLKKYEADFARLIPDFKFVESRFEEMERLRNIVAHHGSLPSDDDFQHVILSFKQWCKQVT